MCVRDVRCCCWSRDCAFGQDIDEILDGSHYYEPQTKMEHVILPEEQKQDILTSIKTFSAFKQHRKEASTADDRDMLKAMVLMFCGPPGTGKTMMVNAAVNWLGKKVLLVDMQKLSKSRDSSERSAIAELFQEAELSDAVLFFDECEAVFRERGTVLNTLLTSIERFSGLVFLATNKPLDIDEAMHRRISKVYMFAAPNSQQRLQLWQSLTAAGLKFHSEVDLFRISLQCVPPLALLHST